MKEIFETFFLAPIGGKRRPQDRLYRQDKRKRHPSMKEDGESITSFAEGNPTEGLQSHLPSSHLGLDNFQVPAERLVQELSGEDLRVDGTVAGSCEEVVWDGVTPSGEWRPKGCLLEVLRRPPSTAAAGVGRWSGKGKQSLSLSVSLPPYPKLYQLPQKRR